ncbi:hypothetical protein ABIE76_002786 [Sinorhizobium fredii]
MQGAVAVAIGDGGIVDANAAALVQRARSRGRPGLYLKVHCERPFAIVSDVTRRRSI